MDHHFQPVDRISWRNYGMNHLLNGIQTFSITRVIIWFQKTSMTAAMKYTFQATTMTTSRPTKLTSATMELVNQMIQMWAVMIWELEIKKLAKRPTSPESSNELWIRNCPWVSSCRRARTMCSLLWRPPKLRRRVGRNGIRSCLWPKQNPERSCLMPSWGRELSLLVPHTGINPNKLDRSEPSAESSVWDV